MGGSNPLRRLVDWTRSVQYCAKIPIPAVVNVVTSTTYDPATSEAVTGSTPYNVEVVLTSLTEKQSQDLTGGLGQYQCLIRLAEIDIVGRPGGNREETEKSWEEFFFSHHYGIYEDIFHSYLFNQPRRSCDAFASATLMCDPWHSNPFPRFETLEELQEWVLPLIQEEEEFEKNKTQFSGNFLPPNTGDT